MDSDSSQKTANENTAEEEIVGENEVISEEETGKKRKELRFYETWTFIILFCLILPLAVRSLVAAPFHIPSDSMKSTLLVGDFLFVDKSAYGYSRYSFPLGIPFFEGRINFTEPTRGDVIVFRPAPTPEIDFIKRLVGLPGDRIQVKKGELYINGTKVKREQIEDFVDIRPNGDHVRMKRYIETLPNGVSYETLDANPHGRLDNTLVYEVPEGHYFMMGDNRDNSSDSRVPSIVGFVPAENLVGKAERIFVSTEGSILAFWTWFDTIRTERFWNDIR